MAEVDTLPRARPASMPTSPRELHDGAPLTPAAAARVVGIHRNHIHARIDAGEMPTTVILGTQRIEPLVAWAARQGASRKTLFDVADALRSGKSVDDIIALVKEGIATSPPEPRRRRGKKKKEGESNA